MVAEPNGFNGRKAFDDEVVHSVLGSDTPRLAAQDMR